MLILPANSLTGGYEIANSLRFNSGSSDYLEKIKTGSNGNLQKWTFSTWVKRAKLSVVQTVFSFGENLSAEGQLQFDANDFLTLINDGQNGSTNETDMKFRDVGAWYHIVWACDSTQAINADRWKVYVNGAQVTLTGSPAITLNGNGIINQWASYDCWIGASARSQQAGNPAQYADIYLSETYFIDGQQLTPTDFGEFDDSGIWKPIKYTGTYGTNGFYLDFENSGSLGTDQSGNGNNFTVNNLTSIDQVTDTPTNNFATFNPLSTVYTADISSMLSEGNTKYTPSGATYSIVKSTVPFPKAGKWYVEAKLGTGSIVGQFGIMRLPATSYATDSFLAYQCNDYCYHYGQNGVINKGSSSQTNVATGLTTWSASDTLAILFDADNNQIKWYNNDSLIYTLDLSSAPDGYYANDGEWVLATSSYGGSQVTNINFGNPSISIVSGNSDADGYGNFEYSTKSGYALCTKNLANYG